MDLEVGHKSALPRIHCSAPRGLGVHLGSLLIKGTIVTTYNTLECTFGTIKRVLFYKPRN